MDHNEFHDMLLKHRKPRQCTRGLYFLFKGDDIVYIGQSETIERTVLEHRDKDYDTYTVLKLSGNLTDAEDKFIAQYQPKYNVQPSNFNPFDYYKQHISARLSGIQTKTLIDWKNSIPSELIKEAMDRVIKECPDKPFGLLKFFMDDWSEKGYRTLQDVQKANEAYEQSKQRRQYGNTKGAMKDAEYQRNIEERGHFKGIPQMDF